MKQLTQDDIDNMIKEEGVDPNAIYYPTYIGINTIGFNQKADINLIRRKIKEQVNNIRNAKANIYFASDTYIPPNIDYMEKGVHTIDLHGLNRDEALDKILLAMRCLKEQDVDMFRSGSGFVPNHHYRLKIITGRSGVLKADFYAWFIMGKYKSTIKTWELINPGCYQVIINPDSDVL